MKKLKYNIIGLIALAGLLVPTLTACSDEPDSENFYTFTGEMMSDFLKNRPEYSEFATILERANKMDLLSTYGKYTCFAPTNDAISTFLKNNETFT